MKVNIWFGDGGTEGRKGGKMTDEWMKEWMHEGMNELKKRKMTKWLTRMNEQNDDTD